jgi:hypothetical protein
MSPCFRKDFCGAATAAHQVEGKNVNGDCWLLEHLPDTIFAEPSGDACDRRAMARQHRTCQPRGVGPMTRRASAPTMSVWQP